MSKEFGIEESLKKLGNFEEFKVLAESDFLRMEFASRNSDFLYLDCDCVLNDEFKIESEKNYFPKRGITTVDYYAFYVGDCKFFQQILFGIKKCFKYYPGIFYKFLNKGKNLNKISKIDKSFFNHLNEGMWNK